MRIRGGDPTPSSAERVSSWVRHSASCASPQKYERVPQPTLHVSAMCCGAGAANANLSQSTGKPCLNVDSRRPESNRRPLHYER